MNPRRLMAIFLGRVRIPEQTILVFAEPTCVVARITGGLAMWR